MDWLRESALRYPRRPALVADARRWTYVELDREVERLASRLADRGSGGVRAGDRVACLLPNGALAALLPHAALRSGVAIAPLNARLTESEIGGQLDQLSPAIIAVDGRTRAAVPERWAPACDQLDAQPEEPARAAHGFTGARAGDALAVIYTSGTTGRPKGAVLSVGSFLAGALASASVLDTRADDRWLAVLPLYHVGGLSILFRCAIHGACAVIHERFDPGAVSRAIDQEGVTIVSLVAAMLRRLLDERGDRPFPPSFRYALVGGGPVPYSLVQRCAAAGIPIALTYGLTEAASQVTVLPPAEALRRPGASGRPLPGLEVRIAAAEPGGEGEIQVRGPTVMSGYFNDPAATEDALAGGWLRTGDIGRLDDDGYLYVLDRRDDLIVTGGENVYPAEVESVLATHPCVEEAAVIGVPDDTWGRRVVAVVRLRPGTGAPDVTESLRLHCRQSLAGYKVPREFRLARDPLPRTPSGKLRRSALR